MEKEPILLIFIKNAVAGKVKTRLAQGVGDAQALRIYQALLQHTRQVVQAVAARRWLFYSDQIVETDDWSTAAFQKYVQRGSDLGSRMHQAFEQAFAAGGPVIIIGSDCPRLTTEIVEKAFARLEQQDFVIGPATDGGYYLLGMRQLYPFLFDNMPWSTENVCQTTLQRIEAHNLSYSLLPELSDVDYEEDWVKYGWDLSR